MPCSSEGYSNRESEIQQAAKLLCWLADSLSLQVAPYERDASKDLYVVDTRIVPNLCCLIQTLTKDQTNEFLYDGRNPMARKLADWWDAHKEIDKKRIAEELKKKEDAKLRKIALNKLTIQEKKLLGL